MSASCAPQGAGCLPSPQELAAALRDGRISYADYQAGIAAYNAPPPAAPAGQVASFAPPPALSSEAPAEAPFDPNARAPGGPPSIQEVAATLPAAGSAAEKAQAAGAAPPPMPGRARAPAAAPAGAAQMQGEPLQDPRDAALSALISPRGGAATPGRPGIGLSPKEYMESLRKQASDTEAATREGIELHKDAVDAFRQQTDALTTESEVARLSMQQSMEDSARHRAELLAHTKERQAKIDEQLSALEAQGVNPNHYWQSQSTPQKIAAAVAVGLGGFAAGLSRNLGGRNAALDIINQAIGADIEAQKTNLQKNLEAARLRGTMNQQGFDQQAALLTAERDSIQTAYSVAMNDVTKRAAMFKDNADFAAHAQQIIGGLKQASDERVGQVNDKLFGLWQRTATSGTSPNTKLQEQIIKRAQELADKAAEAGKEMSPADARRRAASEILGVDVKPGEALPSYAKPQKGSQPSEKGQDQMNALGDAEEAVDQLIALRKKHGGGALSNEESARAEAIATDARARMAHGLGARVTPAEMEVLQKLVPEDPLEMNLAGVVGSDPTMARLQAAKQQLRAHRARLAMNPGAGGAADTSPEALGLEED